MTVVRNLGNGCVTTVRSTACEREPGAVEARHVRLAQHGAKISWPTGNGEVGLQGSRLAAVERPHAHASAR